MTRAFVGRTDEIAALSELLAEAAAGTPRVLLVEGEAGIGKTTLVERFLARHTDARVLRASGDESELGVRFGVVDQLLRSAGVDGVEVLDAGRHLDVGLALLEVVAGRDTVVLVDDAHLADADSLRALLFCARRLMDSPTLIVLVVRGAAHETLAEGWSKLAGEAVLRPQPLTVEEGRALADQLGLTLGADAAARLIEHTGGNPLHLRAVLEALPPGGSWLHDDRPLPVPQAYAQLVDAQLRRCGPDVIALLSAVAVLGVRAPLGLALDLATLDDALSTVDRAVETGLLRVGERDDGLWLAFTHPLTRAAVHERMPQARRRALHQSAAALVASEEAALHHRVEAATVADDALQVELEAAAREASARGAWAVAIKHLLAAARVASAPADHERLLLDAIEALLYSGDGGAARRLAERAALTDSPRRDSVFAYIAMFAGDLDAAEQRLERAWQRRGDDTRLAATVAQRRAFMASSRFRGAEAVEWAQRALALAPADTGTALLAAPSLANGLAFVGRVDEAHEVIDRWLGDPHAPAPGSGYVLLAHRARLLEVRGEIEPARELFRRAADTGLAEGLLVVAGLALSGLARVLFLAGAWDDAVVAAERAIAVAVESEDRWVVTHAQWSAAQVASARGDLATVERLQREVAAEPARVERHIALQQLFAAQLAVQRERPADVLAALAPVAALAPDFSVLAWQHLYANALIDAGELERAEAFIAAAQAPHYPLLLARLRHARARLAVARDDEAAALDAFDQARALVEPLGMPYERALVELGHAQLLRREGRRRAASELLLHARATFATLSALPALRRCEQELAACGLRPAARSDRDEAGLTPQETAVARLVVSGMTNREVAQELMLSAKTVEFHLRNVYLKAGVRSRTELRSRARGHELEL